MTDDRALILAGWDATVTATDLSNTTLDGGTIPAATDLYYFSGDTTSTNAASGTTITPGQPATDSPLGPPTTSVTGTPGSNGSAATLNNTTPLAAMTLSGAVGANQVAWDPTIAVDVPSTAVTGTYTGTITHSVA